MARSANARSAPRFARPIFQSIEHHDAEAPSRVFSDPALTVQAGPSVTVWTGRLGDLQTGRLGDLRIEDDLFEGNEVVGERLEMAEVDVHEAHEPATILHLA